MPFGNDTIKARDGEVDQVECGVGEDTVEADAADVVAASCEKVDNGGGTGGGGGGGAGGNGGGGHADPVADSAGFAIVGRRSLRSGTRFGVNCASACEVRGDLLHKGKRVGSGRKPVLAAGRAVVSVKLTKAGRKRLKRLKKARLTLKVSIKDASGKTTGFSRTIAFKK